MTKMRKCCSVLRRRTIEKSWDRTEVKKGESKIYNVSKTQKDDGNNGVRRGKNIL